MKRWRVALLPMGLVMAVIGVVVGVPAFGVSPLGLSFVFVGGLLVMASAVLPSSSSSSSSSAASPRRRRPPLALVLAPVMAALGVAASAFIDVGIDITAARSNTLAEESVAVARGLATDVDVVAFIDDDRTATELVALLQRYQQETSHLFIERRSEKRADDLERARDLGVAGYLALGGPNLVFVARGQAGADHGTPIRVRFQAGSPNQEEQVTNALRRATTTTTTKVYLLAGHGELDSRDEGPLGLSRLQQALSIRGVEVVPLPVLQVGLVPEDARAVMLLPGTTALTPDEVALVAAAVDRGVGLFVGLEPDQPAPALTSLAASVGVDVVDDVVVDDSRFSAMLGGVDVASGQSQGAHPITRPLRGALTHFPRASLLALTPTEGLVATPVVSTGGEARSHKTGAQGPLPLVVAIEGQGRRAVVAADTTFLDNAHFGQGANGDLAQNCLLWLTAVDDAIVVRPRQKTGALVFLTPSARGRLGFVVVVGVPGLLLAMAAGWAAMRRAA